MKYHKIVVQYMVTALLDIFADGRFADKVIEFYLKKNKKWGSRDRRFFAESVYDIVRNWRKLWNMAGLPDSQYLDKEYISEERIWKIWEVYLVLKGEEPPNWPEVPITKLDDLKKRSAQLSQAQRISWTDEMLNYAIQQGEYKNEKVNLENLNKPAPVFLRVNLLKTSANKLRDLLAAEEIDVEVIDEKIGTLKLKHRQNVFSTTAFKDGLFEVQDISSQMVAPFLNPQPGERVIDACAGAGGKTLHLATLMQNKGRIIALDIYDRKLDELKKRAQRNGHGTIETRVIDGTKTIKRLEESADRVLLDVPCSGSGVLRRNPDSKWKMKVADVQKLLEEQQKILSLYSTMVKPGGTLVYSTCSFFVSENEKQVEKFLSQTNNWELEEQTRVNPGTNDGDGFFMARLRRKK